ncbi:DNA-binding protein [Actinoplanes sp. SE50]|nr:helix-turn-helix domain-containing protein [Actinoplanes sp. SE50/110]ATO80361.1 DNA-binding protein [Actinoplanes sp. SE50]SLL97767.1 helix-turn-helix domain-containing protein, DNA-binding protein [Actinoplanes sp. SE50/110]
MDVATALGWSESKLSRIETAHTGISEPDLDRLLTLYGLRVEDRGRLRDLSRRGRARVWWTSYRSFVTDPYDEYLALEGEAISISQWEAQVMPGLLQTEEYAQAVIETGAGIEDGEVIERRVAVRMDRQRVFTREPPATLRVVLDEGVLLREVGGRDVLARQLTRLYEATEQPGVEVLILPFEAGAHAGLTESFLVLEFPDGTRNPVVHSEGLTGGHFRVKPEELLVYRDAFDDLHERALSKEASRTVIAETRDRLAR